ncbi:MAG: EAL domain-containing protein [Legionellaceae bacterium]|nr:EAL domain-containing protein [Legionellaceae bacterium]
MSKKSSDNPSELTAEVKRLELKLAANNAVLLNVFNKSSDGVVIINAEQVIVYANDAFTKLFDKNIAGLLGEPVSLVVDSNMLEASKQGAHEINIINADGAESIVEMSTLNIDWGNESSQVICSRDITERKKTEEALAYMAEHDVMTDLPNRIVFEKEMAQAIQEAEKRQEHMAVLYLDLDNFKRVNDTLGHHAGDELLKLMASLLRKSTRKGDTVARLAGDEFALVLTHLRKPEYAAIVAENIINKTDSPFMIDGKEVYINMSIGIAVYPLSSTSAVDLMKHANMAVHAAKHNGKNQYRFYSDALDEESERSLEISTGLRNALQKDELFIMYQPIIDLKTGACSGIEALLRWEHPKLGTLYPKDFLFEAEKMSLMLPIGKWVTRKVFSEFKQLDATPLLFVSVNITADELSETKVVQDIFESLRTFDVDIDKVIFELTETSFVNNPERLVEKINELFNVRINLAIDDYGTGYSSLSYLKRLPISILKIDQSFVQGMGKTSNDHLILLSTIELAHNLGIKVIAEGVEDKEQLDFLTKNKCDYAQGYYLSRPLLLEDAIQFIKKSK